MLEVMPVQPGPVISTSGLVRMRLLVKGIVQGIGFRPYIFKIATARKLSGFTLNTTWGVLIEIEGAVRQVEEFISDIKQSPPENCEIWELATEVISPCNQPGFQILSSDSREGQHAPVIPDLATCDDCLSEIFDPANRRYLYPFTNCTKCGPRYSIINALPYDRRNTSMVDFTMCDLCQNEYDDPGDRRFHAEVNACSQCGPIITYMDTNGVEISQGNTALTDVINIIKRGGIVAIKGLGGFQLLVDARDQHAVQRLRDRKLREAKPFAVMFSTLQEVEDACFISFVERRLLTGREQPIVILRRRSGWSGVADNIAPENPYLGVMLPYTPLHHLLMSKLQIPLVATSGNLSEEPIITDNAMAVSDLCDIADAYLMHDRPIVRPLDDSVLQEVCGHPQVLRLARGYAPLPVKTEPMLAGVVAMGGHAKTALAATGSNMTLLCQHIGDMKSPAGRDAYTKAVRDLVDTFLPVEPGYICCDSHPDYVSTRFAQEWALDSGLPVVNVQHHVAHIAAGMAEHNLKPPLLGVAWDGTGYGDDGTIWGGEFFHVTASEWKRIASFRRFPLPGGHAAIRETARVALGMLYEIYGKEMPFDLPLPFSSITQKECKVLLSMCENSLNAPLTSSVGRIFDAVSSILGLCQYNAYEGQAACLLEWAGLDGNASRDYEFLISPNPVAPECQLIDWEPVILKILDDMVNGVPIGDISASFHDALAKVIVSLVRELGCDTVLLSGGCFQNRTLTESAVKSLTEISAPVFWHRNVPPGDGGIALGQAVWAGWQMQQEKTICA